MGKHFFILIDGLGDKKYKAFDNKTPLEFADTPNLDYFARVGKNGVLYPVEEGFAPESDVAGLSLLGYSLDLHPGRGAFECIGSGRKLKEGKVAFRTNLAQITKRGKLIDAEAGYPSDELAKEIIQYVNEKVDLDVEYEFFQTLSYRGILILRGDVSPWVSNLNPAYKRKWDSLASYAVPRDKELKVEESMPLKDNETAKRTAKILNEFFFKAYKALKDTDWKANCVLIRDAGVKPKGFVSVEKKYNKKFVGLYDMPVQRGLFEITGFSELQEIPVVDEVYLSNMKDLFSKMMKASEKGDFVFLHIKGPDHYGHQGSPLLKARSIELLDKSFFRKMKEEIDLNEDHVCITSDHSTVCKVKSHTADPVPVVISDGRDEVKQFGERYCKEGDIGKIKGENLLPYWFK